MQEVVCDKRDSKIDESRSKFLDDIYYRNDRVHADKFEPSQCSIPLSEENTHKSENTLPGNDTSARTLPGLSIVDSATGDRNHISHNPERMELSTNILNHILKGGEIEDFASQLHNLSRRDRSTLAGDLLDAAVEYRSSAPKGPIVYTKLLYEDLLVYLDNPYKYELVFPERLFRLNRDLETLLNIGKPGKW
ncbi:MAG: hypothetical protein HC888_13220 [Candidatus Competibacteraceae bacterium]|nr:hypothetical protein [Candidatus Competibacteraceae bacterium]